MAKPSNSSLLPTRTRKHTEEEKASARKEYLAGRSFGQISEATGTPESVIRKWGSNGDGGSPGISWTTEREEIAASVLDDAFAKRKMTVSRTATLSVELLEKGVEHLAGRELPLSSQELERMASVVNTLDRIARLDSGNSTSNVNVAAKVRLSLEDIQAVLRADPLADGE